MEKYCKNCTSILKTPSEVKPGILEKHRTPVIAVFTIIGIEAFSSLMPTPLQEVQMDTVSFKISAGFGEDKNLAFDETDDGVRYISRYWESEDSDIRIDVTYPKMTMTVLQRKPTKHDGL